MHAPIRTPLLPLLLLFAATPLAMAESPMPDPIAPAVIGRPLDQIRPSPPVRERHLSPRPARAATPARSAKATRPAKPRPAAIPVVAPQMGSTAHRAKQALDDRADPSIRVDDVGKGEHFARKALGPGVYFGDRHRSAVRKYYEEHPLAGGSVHWKIGEPLPRGTSVAAVPQGLLASLPRLPPGHRYAQVGGEVVLIASGSGMVVDGISRSPR